MSSKAEVVGTGNRAGGKKGFGAEWHWEWKVSGGWHWECGAD